MQALPCTDFETRIRTAQFDDFGKLKTNWIPIYTFGSVLWVRFTLLQNVSQVQFFTIPESRIKIKDYCSPCSILKEKQFIVGETWTEQVMDPGPKKNGWRQMEIKLPHHSSIKDTNTRTCLSFKVMSFQHVLQPWQQFSFFSKKSSHHWHRGGTTPVFIISVTPAITGLLSHLSIASQCSSCIKAWKWIQKLLRLINISYLIMKCPSLWQCAMKYAMFVTVRKQYFIINLSALVVTL